MSARNTIRIEKDALNIRLDGREDFHQLSLSVDDAEEMRRPISEAVNRITEERSPNKEDPSEASFAQLSP